MPLNCGVPQGSGGAVPTLFSIYIYADDIQIYISFKPNQGRCLACCGSP